MIMNEIEEKNQSKEDKKIKIKLDMKYKW